MSEGSEKFDARLQEGVAYFEQMLKVMPDDRTTLEFLVVAYPQMGETAKGEHALAELTRVLLKENDLESAAALLPRLDECASDEAKAAALRVRAARAPRPELIPEAARPEPSPDIGAAGAFAAAKESEAQLADLLGESETAEHLRNLPDNGRLLLVSALSTLEKEKPDACAKAILRLAHDFGDVPVPLDAFGPDRGLLAKLPAEMVRLRGVIPFAQLGKTALVVTLSPHDRFLRRQIREALGGGDVRFYLAEPTQVEALLEKIASEES